MATTANSVVSSVTQIMASQGAANAANTNRNSASEATANNTSKDFGTTLREQQQRHENTQQTKASESKSSNGSQSADKTTTEGKSKPEQNAKAQDEASNADIEGQDASSAVAAQLLQNLQLSGNAQTTIQTLENKSENLTPDRQNTPLSTMLAALGKNVRTEQTEGADATAVPSSETNQDISENIDFKDLLQTKQSEAQGSKEVLNTSATANTQVVAPTLNTKETTQVATQDASLKSELETAKTLDTKAAALDANQSKSFGLESEPGVDASKAEPIIDTATQSASAQTLAAHQISNSQAPAPTKETAPAPTIYSAVGSQKWGDDLGQQMVWMAKGDESKAQIQLTPPHMGPIEVSISIKGDQATATFLVSHAQTKEALEQAIPKLREVFEQAGIQLGQANVQSGTQQHTNPQGQNSPRSAWMNSNENQNEDKTLVTQGVMRLNQGGSGVDIFA